MIVAGLGDVLISFPYTPIMSMSQFEVLNSFVYRIEATKDEKHVIKYAFYEGLELYLKENE